MINLGWQQHNMEVLQEKLSKTIYALRRIRSIKNIESCEITYYVLFESNYQYGIIARGGASQTSVQEILNLQKKIIRTNKKKNPKKLYNTSLIDRVPLASTIGRVAQGNFWRICKILY